MGQSRASQISTKDTPYYHITSHVVRNNVLCGINAINNIDYGSRKQWVIDRIRFLSSFFAIDVAGYAIMTDQYNMIVYLNESIAKNWSVEEVYKHWTAIYKPEPIIKKWKKNKLTKESEIDTALAIIEQCRSRLSNISLFMQNLNQYIARRANKEDGCKGHFWQERFKSQPLLDETALITCMSCLDLNPVRVKDVDSIEKSEFTSVFERINGQPIENEYFDKSSIEIKPLISFLGNDERGTISKNKIPQVDHPVINIKLDDYLQLLDWTSRIQHCDISDFIELDKPVLLKELGFSEEVWLDLANNFATEFHCAVGSFDKLERYLIHTGKSKIQNKKRLGDLFH